MQAIGLQANSARIGDTYADGILIGVLEVLALLPGVAGSLLST